MFSCQEISLYILHWSYACLLPWPSITSCLWELLKVKLKMTYWKGNVFWPTRRRIANGNTDARIKKIRLTNHGRFVEHALTRKTFGAHSPRAEVLFFPFISFRDKVICIMLYTRLGSHGPRRNEFRDSFWGIYEKVVGAKKCCMLSCLLMGLREWAPQCPPH